MSIDLALYATKFPEAIEAVLSVYFAAADTHSFGEVDYDFPQVDRKYSRQQFGGELPRPVIVVEYLTDKDVLKRAKSDGIRRTFNQAVTFRVYTADPADLWDVNRNIQDLLGLVLHGDPGAFADGGIRPISVSQPVDLPMDPSNRMQVSQRVVRFRVDAVYPSVDEV